MSRLLPGDYFETQERLCSWFDELRTAAGCKSSADTAAVLRAVERISRQLEEAEEQKAIVAKWLGYKNWGYCVNAAMKVVVETAIVEIPTEYNHVPVGWITGSGKPSWDTCEKRLRKTHTVIRKTLVSIEAQANEKEEGWAEGMREDLLHFFYESTDAREFEQKCLNFVYGIEEEPAPSEVWVSAAELAAPCLEKSNLLPPVAAEELITYAEEAGVEVTKQDADWKEESNNRETSWFSYLLAAYLSGETRPNKETVNLIYNKALTAASLGNLYDKEALVEQTGRMGKWNNTATLNELEIAYRALLDTWSEEGNWADTRDAVRKVLGLTDEIKS